MKRRRLWLAGALGILLVVAGALGLNTLRAWLGLALVEHTPEALGARLRAHYAITRPEGVGPFPTALLFSGCDGPKDNLTRLAAALAGAGWAAVVVDSHGPRGLDEVEQWRLVCAGQLLTGAERAADVAVAIDDARRMAFVDPTRLALVGASHGGWAVLDLLALLSAGELSPILARWPESIERDGLAGVRAAILLYPYCGALSRAAAIGWREPIPTLFALVAGDTIADDADCRALARRLAAAGRPVEVRVFEGVTHGFDQADKATLSTLEFDPEAAARARVLVTGFLERHAGR